MCSTVSTLSFLILYIAQLKDGTFRLKICQYRRNISCGGSVPGLCMLWLSVHKHATPLVPFSSRSKRTHMSAITCQLDMPKMATACSSLRLLAHEVPSDAQHKLHSPWDQVSFIYPEVVDSNCTKVSRKILFVTVDTLLKEYCIKRSPHK